MSSHPDPERLADLATGESAGAEESAHVAGCTECSAELDALRELAGRMAGLEPVAWLEPPATVRAAVLAAARGDTRITRPRRWLLVAAAAAVGVIAGVLAGVLGERLLTPAPVPAPEIVLASTRLDTLDTGVQEGTATLVQTAGGAVELRVATTPVSAGSGYLEVWLINIDGKRMVSVGVLSNGTTGTFPVANGLIDAGYVIVDISREGLDDKPQHSGDSVVRGKLSL